MKRPNLLSRTLCAATLLCSAPLASTAHAAIINHAGYSYDDSNNYVTGNGLDWLCFDQTILMSANTALSTYSADGWAIASNAQVAGLLNSFFPTAAFDSDENTNQTVSTGFSAIEDDAEADRIMMSMFGKTETTSGGGFSDPREAINFIFGTDSDNDGLINRMMLRDDFVINGTQVAGQVQMTGDNLSYSSMVLNTGVALVRTSASTSVPTPTPLALLLALPVFGLLKNCKRRGHHLLTQSNPGSTPRSLQRTPLLALLLALFFTQYPNAALAAIISADLNSANDGLLTQDTQTGLEWLDITATQGQSVNDVIAGYGGYTTSNGFRHATQSEVETFWGNYGLNPSNSAGTLDSNQSNLTESFIGLVGQTTGGSQSGTPYISTLGFLNFPRDATTWYLTRQDAFQGTDQVYANVAYASGTLSTQGPNVGHWLVRETASTAAVNGPQTLALLGLGLLYIARRRA